MVDNRTIMYGNSYLWTYDSYGPVGNAFDAGSIHNERKYEAVRPWKSRGEGYTGRSQLTVHSEVNFLTALPPSGQCSKLEINRKL
jgi:hypothetical protein